MRLLAVLATSVGLTLLLSAHADTWGTFGAVQCGDSAVAIRFGGQVNFDPPYVYALPKSLADDWAAAPVDRDARCELADGSVVVVTFGQSTSMSVKGAGTMDPPAWVDVWINGRRILTEEMYKTAGAFKPPWLNSIIVTPATIARCGYSEFPAAGAEQSSSSATCELSHFDLKATALDEHAPTVGAIPHLLTQRRERVCDTDECRSEAEWQLVAQVNMNSKF